MKYLWIIALFAISVALVPETAVAQKLSKKERKRLKKEKKKRLKALKKLSAADFQQQQDERNELMAKATELESELSTVNGELSQKENQVKQLQDQVRRLENRVSEADTGTTASDSEQNVPMASAGSDAQYDQGLIFRVQIGAYQNQSLAEYNTSVNFNEDNGPNNMQMYTLGNFRDYWEADTFKKYLRQMGVRDAWIVPYEDGQRRQIKEVLEQLRNNASLK